MALGVVTVGALVTATASHLAGALQPEGQDLGWLAASPAIARFALAMLAFLISFVAEIAVIQFIAWLLGGRGSFTELSFLIAVYAVPIDVLSSVFSSAYGSSPVALPFLCLLPIYSFALRYVAVRAAHRLPPGLSLVALVPGSIVAACATLSIYLASFPWPQHAPRLIV
jgi:hypothetical protein